MTLCRTFSTGIVHENSSAPAQVSDYLMDFGPYLPFTLTQASTRPAVRVLGLALHFVWFLPAMAAVMLPILALMICDMVAETVKGQ